MAGGNSGVGGVLQGSTCSAAGRKSSVEYSGMFLLCEVFPGGDCCLVFCRENVEWNLSKGLFLGRSVECFGGERVSFTRHLFFSSLFLFFSGNYFCFGFLDISL